MSKKIKYSILTVVGIFVITILFISVSNGESFMGFFNIKSISENISKKPINTTKYNNTIEISNIVKLNNCDKGFFDLGDGMCGSCSGDNLLTKSKSAGSKVQPVLQICEFGCLNGECTICELCDFQDQDLQKYQPLLTNIRILNAIELNTYINLDQYLPDLIDLIKQLETNDTSSWNNYRELIYNTQGFWTANEDHLRRVFLQKIAISLYVEANNLVPWSILNYSDHDLNFLLGDKFADSTQGGGYANAYRMFNNNPIIAFEYSETLKNLYPNNQINTQKDLLDLLFIRMRDDEWSHMSGPFVQNVGILCQLQTPEAYDFQCLEQIRFGGSIPTSLFIYSILQANNIPSEVIEWDWFYHNGLIMPTLGVGVDGDAIYNQILSGISLKPNYIPVDNSYIPISTYQNYLTASIAEKSYYIARKSALDYLNLYNDPIWNQDLIATYCHTYGIYENYGEFLMMNLTELPIPFVCKDGNGCQMTDPNGADYFPPILTETEITGWIQNISTITDCQ